MPELFGANPFNLLPHLAALAVAYLLALPIGWNREKQERSAGLRTFPLVAVASCGFIQAAESIVGDDPEAIARIVEGIITGMGFIGGGAILRMKESVKGTATAASLGLVVRPIARRLVPRLPDQFGLERRQDPERDHGDDRQDDGDVVAAEPDGGADRAGRPQAGGR